MRILILTQYFWPENFQINDLARGLKEKGHKVEILTGKPNYPTGEFYRDYGFFWPFFEKFNGMPVFRVPLIPRFQSRGWQLAVNYVSFVFFAALAVPIIGFRKYDLVLVFEPSPIFQALPAILLKKIFRTKLALWVLDLWPESLIATGAIKNRKALNFVGRIVNNIYKQCDLILASSENFIPKIRERAGESIPISYFPNWADGLFESARSKDIPPSYSTLSHEFNITFAGNIGKAQSFETILKAAKLLQDVPAIRWQIYGDSRERKWAEETTKNLGLEDRITFHGQRPLSTMPEAFLKSDALLITLKDDPVFKLTVPAKLQAYMAFGKPIVACLDGEGAEIIEKAGAGIVSKSEDFSALAQSVLTLHNLHRSVRERMGENGRKHYEQNFSRSLLFDRVESLLKIQLKNN